MTPPRSVYRAARARTLLANMALRHGVVVYDGLEYEAAVAVDGEGYELTDMGQRTVQRIQVSVPKSAMPERPRRGAMLEYEGMRWEIELVGGDGDGEPGWAVTGVRVPG